MVTIAIISYLGLCLITASSLVLSFYYIRQFIAQYKKDNVSPQTLVYMMFFIGIFSYFLYDYIYLLINK